MYRVFSFFSSSSCSAAAASFSSFRKVQSPVQSTPRKEDSPRPFLPPLHHRILTLSVMNVWRAEPVNSHCVSIGTSFFFITENLVNRVK